MATDIDGNEIKRDDEVIFVEPNINWDTITLEREFGFHAGDILVVKDCGASDISVWIRDGKDSWAMPARAVRLAVAEDLTEQQEIDKMMADIASATPNLVLLNGQLQGATFTNVASGAELLKKLREGYARKLSSQRSNFMNREYRLKQEMAQMLPVPRDLSIYYSKAGMQFSLDGRGNYVFIMPFKFAPEIATYRKEVYELSKSDREKLAKDCFCRITAGKSGEGHICLLNKDYTVFSHYHYMGSGYDCSGIYIEGCNTAKGAWAKRDEYERTLKTINGDSLAHNPRAMPNFETLIRHGKKVGLEEAPKTGEEPSVLAAKMVGGVWTTMKVASPFTVGQLVRVIKTFDAFRYIGVVGKVVHVGTAQGNIGVEFIPFFGCGYNCAGNGQRGHCYYFPPSHLEATPAGTRRTRSF